MKLGNNVILPEKLRSSPSLKELYRAIETDLKAVENELRLFAESPNPIIAEISRYLFGRGGKRIRPALVILCARLYGYRGLEHISVSALVETIHVASLIHDDIIDRSETRRGKPTVHSRWGANITVLLGDYLYIEAVNRLLEFENLEILRTLTGASIRMIDGELEEYHQSGNLGLDEAIHLDILSKKTASLFAASCRLGGLLGKAGPDELDSLEAFGWHLGMTFQLTDDLLDYTGDNKTLGKPVLSDLQEGRITLPLIYALRQAGKQDRDRISRLFKERKNNRNALGKILDFVRSNGALDYTYQKAADFARRSLAELDPLPESETLHTLSLIPEFVLQRNT